MMVETSQTCVDLNETVKKLRMGFDDFHTENSRTVIKDTYIDLMLLVFGTFVIIILLNY